MREVSGRSVLFATGARALGRPWGCDPRAHRPSQAGEAVDFSLCPQLSASLLRVEGVVCGFRGLAVRGPQ